MYTVTIHYKVAPYKYDIYESCVSGTDLKNFIEVYSALLKFKTDNPVISKKGKTAYSRIYREIYQSENSCKTFIKFFSCGKKNYIDNKPKIVSIENNIAVDKIVNILIDGKTIFNQGSMDSISGNFVEDAVVALRQHYDSNYFPEFKVIGHNIKESKRSLPSAEYLKSFNIERLKELKHVVKNYLILVNDELSSRIEEQNETKVQIDN